MPAGAVDNGTAAALRSLPKRLSTFPIAWFLSTRPGQGSETFRTAFAELETSGAETVSLGPLAGDAVARVVADILGGEPDDSLLGHARRTQGNPFVLVELYQLFGFEAALDHLDVAARTGTSEDVRTRLAQFFRCWPLAALDRFEEALTRAEEGDT